MWCEFTASTVIGLLLFEEMRDSGLEAISVTSKRYTNMLQNRVISRLADKHLWESTTVMHYDSPLHTARQIEKSLVW